MLCFYAGTESMYRGVALQISEGGMTEYEEGSVRFHSARLDRLRLWAGIFSNIIYDIGENTLKKYKEIIDKTNTVFINGTIGLYEDERFKKGTTELFNILNKSKAKTYVGGGDAVSAANKLGFEDAFYYKSTGGGATLEYIIDKSLKALED